MESLLEVLMRRDSLSRDEAQGLIREARNRVYAGEDPEEVLAEEFGLEPDWVFDLVTVEELYAHFAARLKQEMEK